MNTAKPTATNSASESYLSVWQKYRPKGDINFSDIIDEKTIYDNTRTNTTFNSEISNHSSLWSIEKCMSEPDFDADAVTVDDILGNSIVHEIQQLSQNRVGGGTTSMRPSLAHKHSTSSLFGSKDFSYVPSESLLKENFKPAEEMLDQLQEDERKWEQEHADIPPIETVSTSSSSSSSFVSHKLLSKMHGKLTNMSDFSGFLCYGNSDSAGDDMSIGGFFKNRCQDLQEMITSKSPTKHIPMALISNSLLDDTSQRNDTHNYGQDKSVDIQAPKISSSTYNKDDDNVVSLSTIASHLDDSSADSPQTIVNKILTKHSELTKANVKRLETETNSILNKSKASPSQQHSELERTTYPHSQSTTSVDFNRMMNSTEINDTPSWRQTNIINTKNSDDLDDTASVTLSNFSSIKDHSPHKIENQQIRNKRLHSPLAPSQPTTKYSSINDAIPQKENSEHNMRLPSRMPRTSVQAPLDDVSSILNNLRIDAPHRNQQSKSPVYVRRCETDLKPVENQLIGDHRTYVNQNRSLDAPKLSLPSYGLHGIRNSHPDDLIPDKRSHSQLSSHSEFSQQDGKFPLKSNTSELVWECVKLRKSITKSFVIKNISEKKLSLRVGVIGPGFQLASTSDVDSIVLQGNECRTINIIFCPTIIGKAIGKVVFRPSKNWREDIERSVNLWAYGGSTVLQLKGLERGPVGCSFLKMGETSNITSTTLNQSFSIYNKGPLNGVATIFIKHKTNQCINESNISIEPKKCVIRPDCSTTINVSYKLRRKDLEKLRRKSCDVLTIGTFEVILGSEPNRQRIASMLLRDGAIPSAYNQLEFLVNCFPVDRLEHFHDYREHIDNVSDLFSCFRTFEIALTINRTNLDESHDDDLSGIDESVLFRTLCETPREHPMSSPTLVNPIDDVMWSVQPKRLTMDNRHNSRKSIVIQSFFPNIQTFQVDSTIRNYLKFSMRSGQLKPNGEIKIDIEVNNDLHISPLMGNITIYVETDSFDIPISIQPVPYN